MKIILLEDVKTLGKKGEVVNVSDGYANNMLLPQKKGVIANEKNLNELKGMKKREEKNAAEQLKEAQALAKQLESKTVEVRMKAGEGGRVFGSVSGKEIAKAAKEQFDLQIDKKKLSIPEPIRSFGVHEITLKLHPQVSAMLRVHVSEE